MLSVMRGRGVVIGLVGWLVACDGEFFSTLPRAPGAPTAPSEVVAVAGPDLVVVEGSRVVLAAGASRALRGEPVLSWTQREGPLVTLSNPSSPAPIFVAPLGPARLVFVLEATADAQRDEDTVIVEVVTDPSELRAPAVVTLPADRVVAVDELVIIEAPWGGVGVPAVTVRCPTLSPDPLGQLVDGVLRIEVAPRALPCPVVVEDSPPGDTDTNDDDDDDDGDGVRPPMAGRAALLLWGDGVEVSPASRAAAPAMVAPDTRVDVTLDPGGRAFVVDGRPLQLDPTATGVSFLSPRAPGRLALLAETRRADSSGGTRMITIEVGAGAENAAPTASGGPDRRIRPGARFRIAPTGSDDDGDVLSFRIEQVLGLRAEPVSDSAEPGVAIAPSVTEAETLLFFVVADDGVAASAPDPVRVVVDPAAENLPPILDVPPELYVTPRSPFVIDASGASDPDAGLVVGFRFAQAADDPVQLLSDVVVDEPRLALVAGAAGERYRFLVSVVDSDGLEAVASVVVIVEEAGPYVDPTRAPADDGGADGTAARPFLSINDAVATAVRHRFETLRLVASAESLEVPTLPDGLGLEGGFQFDPSSGEYAGSAASTSVALLGPAAFGDVTLSRLSIGSGPASVQLLRRVDLLAVDVVDDVTLELARTARIRCIDSQLSSAVAEGRLELVQTSLRGGLSGHDAVVVLGAGSVVGTPDLDVAIELQGGSLSIDAEARVVGGAAGVRLRDGAVATVAGHVGATGVETVGVDVVDGTVVLEGATVEVEGATATGVRLRAGSVGGRALISVHGDEVIGVDAVVALGTIVGGTIEAVGVIDAVGVRGPDVALDRLHVVVSGPRAVGVDGYLVTLTASLIEVSGEEGDGVIADEGSLRHVTVVSSRAAVTGHVALRVDNSLAFAPTVFAGSGVVAGVVGVVGSAPEGCARCVSGPREAIDVHGRLVDDLVLGVENPFVDAGDPQTTVPFDLFGVAIPQGEGPDLGACERVVPLAVDGS
jgi:hypothetical protein